MEPFDKLTGVVLPMNRVNVDTDQIIPKQFLKRVERTGFGSSCFSTGATTTTGLRTQTSS